MHVVITGGAGFIGKKLASALLARGALETASGRQAIEKLTLFDMTRAEGMPDDARVTSIAGDITDLAAVHQAIRDDVGGVFHLAAIVSANAEEDFDLGMRVNEGTRNVLEACRALPQPARLVFASSVAVYGGDMPEVLDDGTILTPQTSYGAQKAIGELLLNDYSRKGFVDGRALLADDHRGAPRPAQPGRLDLRQLDHPRAARRPGGDLPGRARRRHVHPVAAPGGRGAGPRLRAAARGVRRDPDADPARHHGVDRRDGRRAAGGRGRAGRRAGQVAAGPDDPEDRGRLARGVRCAARAAMGFAADPDFASIIRAHVEDELGGRIA